MVLIATHSTGQVQNAMRRVPEWFVPFVRKMFNEPSARFWSECLQKGKVSAHPVAITI